MVTTAGKPLAPSDPILHAMFSRIIASNEKSQPPPQAEAKETQQTETEHLSASHARISLIGDRDSQQDKEVFLQSDKAMLAVVADGAGGFSGGERASFAAVNALTKTWEEKLSNGVPPAQAEEILNEACHNAHREVIAQSGGEAKLSGKCAIVVLYLYMGNYTVANVGDCRAYLAHEGSWQQLTTDDSLLRILLKSGEITPEEARNHPDQSCLTQALGTHGKMKPHVSSGCYSSSDKFLLCCDGLWNQLPDDRWTPTAWQASSPLAHQDMLRSMGEAAVQAANGKSDNVSAIWIHTLPSASLRSVKRVIILSVLMLLSFFIGALLIIGSRMLEKNTEPQTYPSAY